MCPAFQQTQGEVANVSGTPSGSNLLTCLVMVQNNEEKVAPDLEVFYDELEC